MIEFDDDTSAFEELLSDLTTAYKGDAKDVDRYRDFQVAFGSPAGKRVLHEIFTWGHIFEPSVLRGAIDPYRTHLHEGHREMALKLKRVMMTVPPEPQPKPKVTRKEPRRQKND
jgi:hypothetical protein|tara:strand:+ start:4827 stop:5168 length:342 start_codon:yes stop_codon:yes gene_type:complete